MSNLSLNELRESVDQKFGDFTVEIPAPTKGDPDKTTEVAFRYYLRASKEARQKLGKAYEAMAAQRTAAAEGEEDGEGATLLDVFKEAFRHLAVKSTDFTKLEKALDDDLVLWAMVVNAYADRYNTQTGEA